MAKRNEELYKKIEETLTTEGGNVKSSGDPFNDNLPEGITPEIVDTVASYTNQFVVEGYEALGKAGVNALKADKKLDEATGTLGLGKFGSLDTVTKRESTSTPPNGEPVTTYGGTRLKVTFSPGEQGLGSAKSAIKAYGAEVLAKKK